MAHDNASWDGIIQQLDENAVEDGNLVNAYFINYNKSRQVREECLRRIYADEQFPPSLKQYFNQYPQEKDFFEEIFITTDTPPTSLVCSLLPYWQASARDVLRLFVVFVRHIAHTDRNVGRYLPIERNFFHHFPTCEIKRRPKPTIAKAKNIGDCWVYRKEVEDDIFDMEPFKKHENVIVLEREQYGNKHLFKPEGLKQWFDSKNKPINPKTNHILMQNEIEKCKLKFQENSYMTWDASFGGLGNYGPIEEEFQNRSSVGVAFISLMALGALLLLTKSQ